MIGYYLFLIDINDPEAEYTYLINWTNKMNMRDVDLNFINEYDKETDTDLKQLVISYKAEGINTYNVFLFDIKSKFVKFWFEAYQLYESPIKGFLLSSNDFLMLNKDGINVINLGNSGARAVQDQNGDERMMHSLGSVSYLKLENTNHIHFRN